MDFSESELHAAWLQKSLNDLTDRHERIIRDATLNKTVVLVLTLLCLLGVFVASFLHLDWWEPAIATTCGCLVCGGFEWEIRFHKRCIRELRLVDPLTDVAPLVNLKEKQ